MKLFIRITLFLTLVVGLFFASCDKEEFKTTVLGKVVATPSIVTNGEELILKIEGNASASGEATVNGKKYYPVVHYLVDIAHINNVTFPNSNKMFGLFF